jgi:S1-C subfamily serine protease
LTVKGFADNEWNPDAPAAEMLAANGFKTDFPQEVLDRVGALKIHKIDTANDLCVLELDRLDKKFLVTPLEMASDDDLGKLHQLDPVMALGYPLGLSVIQSSTATTSPATGVIRSLQRDVSAIGVSVPIIPGNSGGPLIDRRGKVIGITTRTFEATLGVAITVDHARKLLDRLAK